MKFCPLKNAWFFDPITILWIELAHNQGTGLGIALKCSISEIYPNNEKN